MFVDRRALICRAGKPKLIPGIEIIMTKLRLVLLATTALSATQLASTVSHAQSAPLVVAQAPVEGEKKGPPPKGAPPPTAAPVRPAPVAPAAPPPPRPAPPPPPAPAAPAP